MKIAQFLKMIKKSYFEMIFKKKWRLPFIRFFICCFNADGSGQASITFLGILEKGHDDVCNVVLTLWSQFSYWYDVGDNNRITSSKTMSSSFTYLLYMICALELLPPRRQVSSEVSKQSSLAILGPSGRNLDEMKTGLKRLK